MNRAYAMLMFVVMSAPAMVWAEKPETPVTPIIDPAPMKPPVDPTIEPKRPWTPEAPIMEPKTPSTPILKPDIPTDAPVRKVRKTVKRAKRAASKEAR